MTITILFILLGLLLLLLTLRIGYSLGRTMAEGIVKEYACEETFRDSLKLIDVIYPEKVETMKEVKGIQVPIKRKKYWKVQRPRSN